MNKENFYDELDSSLGEYFKNESLSLEDASSNIHSSMKESLPDVTIPGDSREWENPADAKEKISPVFLASKLNAEPPFFSEKLNKKYKCAHHQLPLILYCNSCEDPVCEECKLKGPHDNELHSITSILVAARKRRNMLQGLLENSLGRRKAEILDVMKTIKKNTENIETNVNVIAKEIDLELEGILKRLESASGGKTSILQREISFLQRDIIEIDDLIEAFYKVIKHNDAVLFLLTCRMLREEVEHILTKTFKTTIEQYPYDLPRETKAILMVIREQAIMKHEENFKDDVIFKLREQTKELELMELSDLIPEKYAEINEWIRLAKKFANEFLNYQMVCYYCSDLCTPDSINTNCSYNEEYILPKDYQGFTETPAPNKFHGSKRHYYSKPREDIKQIKFNLMPDLRDPFMAQILYSNLIKIFQLDLTQLRAVTLTSNLDVVELFESFEKTPKKTGYLTKIVFQYVLGEKMGLEEIQVDRLTAFFLNQKELVPYRYFLLAMKDLETAEKLIGKGDIAYWENLLYRNPEEGRKALHALFNYEPKEEPIENKSPSNTLGNLDSPRRRLYGDRRTGSNIIDEPFSSQYESSWHRGGEYDSTAMPRIRFGGDAGRRYGGDHERQPHQFGGGWKDEGPGLILNFNRQEREEPAYSRDLYGFKYITRINTGPSDIYSIGKKK